MLDERQVALSTIRLQSAKDNYLVAEENFHGGHYKTANNRAYYSMFHCIRSVFALEGKDFKHHSQAIGYFNKVYINEGCFNSRFLKMITAASTSRTNSDYEDYYIASKEEAAINIENAKQFYAEVENYVAQRIKAEYIQMDSDALDFSNDGELEP